MNSEAPTLSQRFADTAAVRLGFWAAVLIVVTYVVFALCFIAIASRPPLFVWSGLADYVAYAGERSQVFQHAARASMLAFGPLFVVLVISLHDLVSRADRVYVRIACAFATAFAVLTGVHYFVQLTTVRMGIQRAEIEGLEQVVQANPISAMSAANMLGWTVFLGLASLFLAPAFRGSGVERVIRWALVCNGACCLLGGLGYLLDLVVVVFVTINLGMGGAVLVAAAALSVWFRRRARAARKARAAT